MKKISLLSVLLLCCCAIYAQDESDNNDVVSDNDTPVHLREIPRHNLVLSGGILQPLGDYGDIARAGLNAQISYERYFNKNIGLSAALTHSYNEFYTALSEDEFLISNTTNNFTNTSLELGGVYTLRDNRFQFDTFLRGGISFLNNPNNRVVSSGILGSDVVLSSDNDASNSTALGVTVGVRFNYYFRKQVQIFFMPMYTTTLGDAIVYDQFMGQKINANMSNLNFNIGLKIALGNTYSNGEKRAVDKEIE